MISKTLDDLYHVVFSLVFHSVFRKTGTDFDEILRKTGTDSKKSWKFFTMS
jgi:hypothetical protein